MEVDDADGLNVLLSEEDVIAAATDSDNDDSFANKVKGKKARPFVSYDHILYVHSGKEMRTRLTKDSWKKVVHQMTDIIMDLTLKMAEPGAQPPPTIDWHGFKDGVGILACTDAASNQYAKTIIADIKVGDQEFRGWAKGESGDWKLVTATIPAVLKAHTAGKVLQAINLLNHFPMEGYQILGAKQMVGKDGNVPPGQKDVRILRFLACSTYLDSVKDPLKVRLPMTTTSFRIRDGQ